MEDRVAWQQVSTAAVDILQHCTLLRDRLNTTRYISHLTIAYRWGGQAVTLAQC